MPIVGGQHWMEHQLKNDWENLVFLTSFKGWGGGPFISSCYYWSDRTKVGDAFVIYS